MSSSSTAIWVRSPVWRTAITRSTASRRARNSASVRIGARRRPESRLSRRRCRLASSRVEPLTPRTPSSSAAPHLARESRTCTTVFGGSSSDAAGLTVGPAGAATPTAPTGAGRQRRLGHLLGVVGLVLVGAPRRLRPSAVTWLSRSGSPARLPPRPRRPRRRRRRPGPRARRRSSSTVRASASSVPITACRPPPGRRRQARRCRRPQPGRSARRPAGRLAGPPAPGRLGLDRGLEQHGGCDQRRGCRRRVGSGAGSVGGGFQRPGRRPSVAGLAGRLRVRLAGAFGSAVLDAGGSAAPRLDSTAGSLDDRSPVAGGVGRRRGLSWPPPYGVGWPSWGRGRARGDVVVAAAQPRRPGLGRPPGLRGPAGLALFLAAVLVVLRGARLAAALRAGFVTGASSALSDAGL